MAGAGQSGGHGGTAMPIDTFIAYVGVYDSAAAADADYELVKVLLS